MIVIKSGDTITGLRVSNVTLQIKRSLDISSTDFLSHMVPKNTVDTDTVSKDRGRFL